MLQKNYFHRSHDFVMTERDELAFSRVLRELFPEVTFLEDDYKKRFSQMRVLPAIPYAVTRRVLIVIPSPGQEARMRLNHETGIVMIEPECRVQFDRSQWENTLYPEKKWAFDHPILGWGRFSVSFPRDDTINRKFAMRVLRSINKILYKRTFGHDACRYCLEGGPRCALGNGLRPEGDWTFPDLHYYNDSLWDDRLPDNPTLTPQTT